MNNKEFINYEQSQTLSEINYDGDYDYTYHATGELWERSKQDKKERFLPAPLKQQVFRWFREKYEIHGIIGYYGKSQWSIEILNYKGNELLQIEDDFHSYEEAENAAIDKLIKIAKQQEK